MQHIVLLGDRDFGMLARKGFARFLPPRYERDLATGKPIREFVTLARRLIEAGFEAAPESRPPLVDSDCRVHVLKFGPCGVDSERARISRYGGRNTSEWNLRNLEMIPYWDSLVDLGRRTWALNLRTDAERLRELLREHGRLFVKSIVKGHAEIVSSFDAYMRELGPLELLDGDSVSVLVSEVLAIRAIDAVTGGRERRRTDEWRHWIYKGRRVATSHAFDCDERRTPSDSREANERFAEATAERLRSTEFATTYVLDTCTLAGSGWAVVEANYFFSSGIYSEEAIDAIATAIVRDCQGGERAAAAG
ncbi:MAG: ATP-grasp domain-containing protein [Planctomycetota bacterium]